MTSASCVVFLIVTLVEAPLFAGFARRLWVACASRAYFRSLSLAILAVTCGGTIADNMRRFAGGVSSSESCGLAHTLDFLHLSVVPALLVSGVELASRATTTHRPALTLPLWARVVRGLLLVAALALVILGLVQGQRNAAAGPCVADEEFGIHVTNVTEGPSVPLASSGPPIAGVFVTVVAAWVWRTSARSPLPTAAPTLPRWLPFALLFAALVGQSATAAGGAYAFFVSNVWEWVLELALLVLDAQASEEPPLWGCLPPWTPPVATGSGKGPGAARDLLLDNLA